MHKTQNCTVTFQMSIQKDTKTQNRNTNVIFQMMNCDKCNDNGDDNGDDDEDEGTLNR